VARVSLNLITIQPTPFARKLQIAAEVGYRGIGLWTEETDRLLAAGARLTDIIAVLKHYRLAVSELCRVDGWMYAEGKERAAAEARARRACRLAEFLGAECVVATPSLLAGDLELAAVDFAALCHLARGFGCRVGLEFVGRAQGVRDLATAWQVVGGADLPNGGLVIDSFHFHQGGSRSSDLANIPPERIFLVQVSDCLPLPPGELEDKDRLFPGMGAAALPELVGALRGIGYQGWWSLELGNPDYWQADPFVVAQDGWHALKRLDIVR